MFGSAIEQIKAFNAREFLTQLVSLAFVLCSALIIWKSMAIYTNCESPIVVVLTGSMEPAFFRGDIVVYKLEGKDIPIVHRVIRVHNVHNETSLFSGHKNEDLKFLTKGDNNQRDDRFGIYNNGMEWLNREHIVGRVKTILPYVGMVTIIMNDFPAVKYVVVGILIILVLTNKEQN